MSTRAWTLAALGRILGDSTAAEVVDYVLSLTPGEAFEYCESLLGSAADARAFTSELVKRLESPSFGAPQQQHAAARAGPQGSDSNPPSKQPTRGKLAANSSAFVPPPQSTASQGTGRGGGGKATPHASVHVSGGPASGVALGPADALGPCAPSTCDCAAREHPLLGNCLWCGRVLCDAHVWSACTCGCSLAAHVLALAGGRLKAVPSGAADSGAKGAPNGPSYGATPDLDAVERKDRLLQYDRTSASRTRVLDDDSDYFASSESAWLSPEERAAARATHEAQITAAAANKRGMRITLDFAGRAVHIRDERAEEEATSEARLLSFARGELHGAHGSVGSSATVSGAAAISPSPPPSRRPVSQSEQSRLDAAQSAKEHTVSRGSGSGVFANHTLTGRAGDIYAAIVQGITADAQAQSASHHSVASSKGTHRDGAGGRGPKQGKGETRATTHEGGHDR